MIVRNLGVRLVAVMVLAAGSFPAFSKTCTLSIDGTDTMQFSAKELSVAADCTEVQLTLKHTGKLPAAAMGHNWVLTTTADFGDVSKAAIAAGAAKGYVPEGDARVIAATKMIGGGESTTLTFSTAKLKAGGDYTFFCSFPGHSVLMKGKFNFG